MAQIPRSDILARLRANIQGGRPIVGCGAGSGLSAKAEEAGGADLIVIYNSGRFRMAGRGSLAGLMPYGDANTIVVELGREVLSVVEDVPVLAGVNGTDPYYNPRAFLTALKEMGFSGVQNFPTVGLIDGNFRRQLEATGMSYDREVKMIGVAREVDLLTSPYVFSDEDARAMTEAGADIVVCHMGLTTGGSIGADDERTLDDCVSMASSWAAAAREVRDDVIVLIHGGPVAEPEDASYVLKNAEGLHGFYGASSMERLPAERAIVEQVERFTKIEL
jgi:predicted TIM-barrel enzyme